MVTTITTKTRNKVEPNNFPSLSLFPWYVLMRGFGIPSGQNRSPSYVIPLNFVRLPLSVLWGFPTAFCYGCPPRDLSQVSLKHLSGFPAAFCQVSLQYLVKGPLSISSRHPAFWLVFHRYFLQAFPWHFLRFPWQIATTHLHSWVKTEALRG